MEIVYGLDGIATGFAAVHGARFGLGTRLASGLYLTVDYTVSSRLEKREDQLSGMMEFYRHPVGIGLRWFSPALGHWRLGAGLLGEIDFIRKRIRSLNSGIETAPNGIDVQSGVVPFALAGRHLLGPIFFTAGLGARVVIDKTRYLARTAPESERVVVFSPWRVQPRLSIGLYGIFF
jgi:hypothetical protein